LGYCSEIIEPGIPRLTDEPLEWFDNWEAFLDELHTNFRPYNRIGDAEHELTSLLLGFGSKMTDSKLGRLILKGLGLSLYSVPS
jgi:hypothetical protein